MNLAYECAPQGFDQIDDAILAARRALLSAAKSRKGLPNIPDAQIEVLPALPRGSVRSPGDIATELGLQRSTMSNLLAAMERDDLIVRRPRTDDRRQVDVLASQRALGHLDAFDRASAEIVAEVAAALSDDDVRLLTVAIPALERLRDVLQGREPTAAEDPKPKGLPR